MKTGLPAAHGWLERHQDKEKASILDSSFGACTLGTSSLTVGWVLNGLLEVGAAKRGKAAGLRSVEGCQVFVGGPFPVGQKAKGISEFTPCADFDIKCYEAQSSFPSGCGY